MNKCSLSCSFDKQRGAGYAVFRSYDEGGGSRGGQGQENSMGFGLVLPVGVVYPNLKSACSLRSVIFADRMGRFEDSGAGVGRA